MTRSAAPFVAFAGSNIDRADHVRADPGAIENLMTASARLLSLNGLDPVLDDEGALAWTSLAEADADAELLFLGLADGRGHFAQVPQMQPKAALGMGRAWQAMTGLSDSDLATYGGARAMVEAAGKRFHAVFTLSRLVERWLATGRLDAARAQAVRDFLAHT